MKVRFIEPSNQPYQRTHSPEAVVADVEEAIRFFDEGNHRIAKMLWITDDNFFANRSWALSVLHLIMERGINYNFTVQARYEVGFDDEMLDALKAVICKRGIERTLFIGEYLWQLFQRHDLLEELRASPSILDE